MTACQPRPVGEAGVDHRRRAVEPQSEGRDDPLDEVDDRTRVETERDRFEPAAAFDVGEARAVDHHLGDGRVGEEGLEGAEPGDLVRELIEELVEVRGGQQRLLVAQQLRQPPANAVSRGDASSSAPSATNRRGPVCLSSSGRRGRSRAESTTSVTRQRRSHPSGDRAGGAGRRRSGERLRQPRREHTGVDGPAITDFHG